MRIVFWQNELSLHQVAHIRALAERPECNVILVAETEVYAYRKALGWTRPDFGKAEIYVLPGDQEMQRLIQFNPENSTHIFTTITSYPMVKKAFLQAIQTKSQIGIFAEAGEFRGWKGVFRRLRDRIYALQYGKRIDFLLPTGTQGYNWFKEAGFSPEKLYPYGYWVETPTVSHNEPTPGPVHMIYVGGYLNGKGGDLLMRALSGLLDLDWKLTLVGSGPDQRYWQKLAHRFPDRVLFLQSKPNPEAVALMATADFLVLPTRKDGWGAVVNEALMCGVPVLCSANCGALDLVENSWRGEVFAAYSVPALRESLRRWILKGKRSPALTDQILQWSQRITGTSAANYLLAVTKAAAGCAERPRPLWKD